MKLVFRKEEDSQIKVYQDANGDMKDFSYIEMINTLIKTKQLEDPDISDDFSEAEVKSIKSMVDFINREVCAVTESEG